MAICMACNKTFSSAKNLKRHQKDFHGEGMLQCPTCPWSCLQSRQYLLNQHLRRCPGTKRDMTPWRTSGPVGVGKGKNGIHLKRVCQEEGDEPGTKIQKLSDEQDMGSPPYDPLREDVRIVEGPSLELTQRKGADADVSHKKKVEIPAVREVPSPKEIPAVREVPSPKEIPAVREVPSPKEIPAVREVSSPKEIPAVREASLSKKTPAAQKTPFSAEVSVKATPAAQKTPSLAEVSVKTKTHVEQKKSHPKKESRSKPKLDIPPPSQSDSSQEGRTIASVRSRALRSLKRDVIKSALMVQQIERATLPDGTTYELKTNVLLDPESKTSSTSSQGTQVELIKVQFGI